MLFLALDDATTSCLSGSVVQPLCKVAESHDVEAILAQIQLKVKSVKSGLIYDLIYPGLCVQATVVYRQAWEREGG